MIKGSREDTNKYYAWKVGESYRQLKVRAVQYKGGKCEVCGYAKYIGALDFHHRDPNTKDFAISSKNVKWETLVGELDKCRLLCANCHREIHAEERNLRAKQRKEEAKALYPGREARPKQEVICSACQGTFETSDSERVYCSPECVSRGQEHATWPDERELKSLLEKMPATHVAQQLGVSSSAVKKRCKRLGIPTRPRGFWTQQKMDL